MFILAYVNVELKSNIYRHL